METGQKAITNAGIIERLTAAAGAKLSRRKFTQFVYSLGLPQTLSPASLKRPPVIRMASYGAIEEFSLSGLCILASIASRNPQDDQTGNRGRQELFSAFRGRQQRIDTRNRWFRTCVI